MKDKLFHHLLPAVLLSLLLSGCASTNQPALTEDWKEISSYAQFKTVSDKSLPVIYHLVKIDLSFPGLSITAYPSESRDLKKGITGYRFSKKSGSDIAINTTPYSGRFMASRNLVGIHRLNNEDFSKPVSRYSALVFYRNSDNSLTGKILEVQSDEELKDADYAFGGFFTILKENTVQSFKHISWDSRAAAALTKDGKTLFLMAVEGEHKSVSRGLSYPECARILQEEGAFEALQLDGGGSTCLFINQQNVLSYPVLRRNAAFLGFKQAVN